MNKTQINVLSSPTIADSLRPRNERTSKSLLIPRHGHYRWIRKNDKTQTEKAKKKLLQKVAQVSLHIIKLLTESSALFPVSWFGSTPKLIDKLFLTTKIR